ncbi:hypothetical protein AAC387_Pa08g1070 [Persea americana]
MLPAAMSNSTSLSEEASVSSGNRVQDFKALHPMLSSIAPQQELQQKKIKKKRNLPGNPDPDAEVIALSPKTLMATNRFVCEICNKGFQRDQNLQLHRRGHNLPWKLRQRTSKEIRKKVYVCPDPSCVHHHPSRALGDLTGIKKHFCRKHGEKKWKCEKCSKKYAVQSDWKAHSKTCGTKEYKCDCGTLFSRKDSFMTHRAFCDALAEESARLSSKAIDPILLQIPQNSHDPSPLLSFQDPSLHFPNQTTPPPTIPTTTHIQYPLSLSWDPHNIINPIQPIIKAEAPLSFLPDHHHPATSSSSSPPLIYPNVDVAHPTYTPQMLMSADRNGMDEVGPMQGAGHMITPDWMGFGAGDLATWQKREGMTRDFLGVAGEAAENVGELVSFTGVDFSCDDRDRSFKPGFGFSETWGDC